MCYLVQDYSLKCNEFKKNVMNSAEYIQESMQI